MIEGRTARSALSTLCLCALLALAGCGSARNASAPPLVVALKPQKDPDRMLEDRRKIGEFLAAQLGREVDVVVPSSTQVIIAGLEGGTIDVAYLSASDLVRHREAATLLFAEEIDGETHYESYWVGLASSEHGSIEDRRGRPVAFASRTSTSGFVVPLWHLRERGLVTARGRPEDFFGEGNVLFGTGYVSAIEKVLSGEAEAAAVSAYVLDLGEHLDEDTRAELRVIDRQGPVPTHVLVARSTLDAEERSAVVRALGALNEPDNRALRDAVFVARLVEVDPDEHLGALPEAIAFAERIAE